MPVKNVFQFLDKDRGSADSSGEEDTDEEEDGAKGADTHDLVSYRFISKLLVIFLYFIFLNIKNFIYINMATTVASCTQSPSFPIVPIILL